MGGVPPPSSAKKSLNTGLFSSTGEDRPKLSSAGSSSHPKRRARCWRHSSQPRLCSLSTLLVALFVIGSVPPAPPIGLLTLQIPVENVEKPGSVQRLAAHFNSSSSPFAKQQLPVVIPAPKLSIANNNTSLKKINASSSCFYKQAVEKDCDMSYLATFPGSGSELCLELIEGLTAIKTGHAYPFVKNNTSQKVVTMKTHYPNKILRGGNPKHSPVPVTRAILLLRNPINALPSFFNFLHEQKSNQRHHYFQAPVEEWIAWRDDDFSSKLFLWRFHMDYWLSQYHLLPTFSSSVLSSSNTLLPHNASNDRKRGNKTMILIGFENLVHKVKGPLVLQDLSHYLQQHENVTAITAQSQVACAWDHIVVRRSANKRRRKTIDRYVPPYRNEQLQDVLEMLQMQRDRYRDQYPQLVPLLQEYMVTVQARLELQLQNTSQTTR